MTIAFNGRVAVVTGAGNGLGKSYALALAARGARVVVNDLGGAIDGSGVSGTPADAVVEEIRAAGGEAVANYDSVAEPESAANIVQTAIDAFGQVDIVINNAGIVRDKTFHKMSLEDYEFVARVHFLGSVYVTHAAYPHMRDANYGRILMVSSNSGLYGNFGQTNYSAAKMAVIGFMNTLKLEGARSNIVINALAPLAATRIAEPSGIFDTYDPELVTTDAVAAMVTYLVSEDCTDTGNIVAATAGYYSRIQIVESEGVRIDPRTEMTPDKIADLWPQIHEMRNPQPYEDGVSNLTAVMAKE
ncbi:MAG: SDR family NAD(P)-dependent oxidoreductase [Rhodospirillaceae bacterium]|jgi:NAD(P)-dependent dehydrogenase (short-subunit alcohol dehydrogenase family)|nr:SDR family NAD(P)-dependent oxidoreductase [Rhodospirillaceae bacterium]MBT5945518.1 SDR family NAD(P)-dependent oxidoreductase [Rhodospirillaceae bacterium]MBT6403042.1 SDR family NAD(P)-dependent oxidoreductase [Rhodospirillaceae bacterium]MBT6536138.1 SDR family NAD(P)-dependent oxidoreductase [Rhodospirillaceae bacterium]MBT7360958.1 SDR family NAD(P)-dependent oxidoreductase [Rhodospirillaceae bacterium]